MHRTQPGLYDAWVLFCWRWLCRQGIETGAFHLDRHPTSLSNVSRCGGGGSGSGGDDEWPQPPSQAAAFSSLPRPSHLSEASDRKAVLSTEPSNARENGRPK